MMLELNSPSLTDTVTLFGEATVHVDLGGISDPDSNGQEQVQTEIVALELSGFSPIFGTVILRQSTSMQSLGEVEEDINNISGLLDIPPFTESGTAISFFDVFFDLQVDGQSLHNTDPRDLEAQVTHKPTDKDRPFEGTGNTPLDDENNDDSGWTVTDAILILDPTTMDEDYAISSTVTFDPLDHFSVIGPLPDSLVVTSFDSSVTIRGDSPWVAVSGPVNPDGSFTLHGSGTVAGFSDVSVVFNGTFFPDGSIVGSYSLGADGELFGEPITYFVDGGPITT